MADVHAVPPPARRRCGSARWASTTRGARRPKSVVRNALATQAQDFLGTLWSVGLRTPAATAAERRIGARGRPVRAVLADARHPALRRRRRPGLDAGADRARGCCRPRRGAVGQLGLTDGDYERAEGVARDRLAGGGQATRAELLGGLRRGRGRRPTASAACTSSASSRSSASWCSRRATRGRCSTSGCRSRGGSSATRRCEEFALRYFTSHGPATVKDFAWWSSLTLTDARAGLAAARDRLDELELDGETYYLRPGLEPAPTSRAPAPRIRRVPARLRRPQRPAGRRAREHRSCPAATGCSCRRSSSTARSSASGSGSARRSASW